MIEQSAAFHHTKYIKSHDNLAQIILPSKINCMATSDEIQNHLGILSILVIRTVWPLLMKSKIIRKISHRLRLHTAWPPLMKSNII